jgi:hypothetical protein
LKYQIPPIVVLIYEEASLAGHDLSREAIKRNTSLDGFS